MKALLEFSLPEEQVEFDEACTAHRTYGALADIAEVFRAHRKYDGPAPDEEMFYAILNDHKVEL